MSTPEQLPPDHPNAAALAWLDAWYATPDTTPPGDWDVLEALIAAHPFTLAPPDTLEVCDDDAL